MFSLGDRSWIDRVNFKCVETHDRLDKEQNMLLEAH